MGSTLDSIFAVNISLANAAVQQKGFGRPLVLGSSNRFTGGDLYRIYTSLAGMVADGFLTTDLEYKAASSIFSQPIAPPDIMVGYAPTDVAQVETITPTAINTTLYTVTINGVASTYTSDGSATAAEIVTGLAAAINAQVPALPVVTSGTTTLILTALVTGEGFTVSIGANLALAHTTPEVDVATALSAMVAAGGKDWYGLVLTSRTLGDIITAAAWIEAQAYGYIFIGCSQDAAVLTAVTTDVAYLLKATNPLRSAYLWSDDQAHYPEAAWLGEEFPKQPGSSNYAWKTLAGITATLNSVMTDSKIGILEGKNGNYYISVGGVPVTQKGKMAGGQWIDVVVGRDWIKANIQQELFNLLIRMPKIGFDDPGIGALANVLRGVLNQAVEFNIIQPGFVINVPLASSFSPTVKSTRILPSIPWSAELVGAINGGTITGTLTA